MEGEKIASSCKMALNEQRKQKKKEVCESILCQLRQRENDAAAMPAFADELQTHFDRLPTRYALYVHIDRADDVLIHKRLLEEVKDSDSNAVFHVCAVPARNVSAEPPIKPFHPDEAVDDPPMPNSKLQLPALALSRNEEASASELNSSAAPAERTEEGSQHSQSSTYVANLPMHEVTISSIDKPKLLSQLSALLADVGLNIREAHVFSTTDGYSLDVFVVDGWPTEDTEDMKQALTQAISTVEAVGRPGERSCAQYHNHEINIAVDDVQQARLSGAEAAPEHLTHLPGLTDRGRRPAAAVASTGSDDWEIDSSQLKFVRRVSTGSSGDLYQGSYCGQDVAIKVLKAERMNDCLRLEFQQEVFVMRKVRHKNIVQFIGACTKPPNFCIVTEYMSGGSVYDYLHQQKAVLKMPMLLRVAIDVSKGMDYLHQNKIIHRDLKAANLLMDENEVVKVADFGVARVEAQSGIMTAETGTYRWMAPEVIEHKPYDSKADVFSFGIVLWELLTGQVPYEDLTPLQAAVGVVKKGLRPTVPENIDPTLKELLQRCWNTDPSQRPGFSEITVVLEEVLKQVNRDAEGGTRRHKDKKLAGLFAAIKRPPTL